MVTLLELPGHLYKRLCLHLLTPFLRHGQIGAIRIACPQVTDACGVCFSNFPCPWDPVKGRHGRWSVKRISIDCPSRYEDEAEGTFTNSGLPTNPLPDRRHMSANNRKGPRICIHCSAPRLGPGEGCASPEKLTIHKQQANAKITACLLLTDLRDLRLAHDEQPAHRKGLANKIL